MPEIIRLLGQSSNHSVLAKRLYGLAALMQKTRQNLLSVLAKFWWGHFVRNGRPRKANGIPCDTRSTVVPGREFNYQISRSNLRILEHVADGVHWSRRYLRAIKFHRPFARRFLEQSLGNHWQQNLAVPHTFCVSLKLGILRQLPKADYFCKTCELRVICYGNDHSTITGRKALIRNDTGVRIAVAAWGLSGHEETCRLIGKSRDLNIKQREIDILADTAALALT